MLVCSTVSFCAGAGDALEVRRHAVLSPPAMSRATMARRIVLAFMTRTNGLARSIETLRSRARVDSNPGVLVRGCVAQPSVLRLRISLTRRKQAPAAVVPAFGAGSRRCAGTRGASRTCASRRLMWASAR